LSISGGGGQIATIYNNTVVQAMVVGGAWQVRNVGWAYNVLTTESVVGLAGGEFAGGTVALTEQLVRVYGSATVDAPSLELATYQNVATFTVTALNTGLLSFYAGGTVLSQVFAIDDAEGLIYKYQPEPTSKSAAATLTIAELRTGIIRYTGGAATLTLPTGTNIENGVSGIEVNLSFDFDVINTGTATATIGTASGLTLIGAMSVTTGTSGVFRVRKTATNTFTVYRLG
jgi:hypothetical protein